jgi:hypothetical protein
MMHLATPIKQLGDLQPEDVTDELLITKQFRSAIEFSQHIERTAITRKIGCMEALMEFCEERDIEPATIAGMITPALKDKIRVEAENLHLLKRTSETLEFE